MITKHSVNCMYKLQFIRPMFNEGWLLISQNEYIPFHVLSELIPRPARPSDDPPLYLRLRMGKPIGRPLPRTTPLMSYGRKRMKPEYWFGVPRNRRVLHTITPFCMGVDRDYRTQHALILTYPVRFICIHLLFHTYIRLWPCIWPFLKVSQTLLWMIIKVIRWVVFHAKAHMDSALGTSLGWLR